MSLRGSVRASLYWPRSPCPRPLVQLTLLLATCSTVVVLLLVSPPSSLQSSVQSLESDHILVEQTLSQCGHCRRLIVAQKSTKHWVPANTTCELESFARGPHQLVVAFSYFEPVGEQKVNREYLKGVEENLRLIKRHYKGFTMRLYHDLKAGSPTLSSLCELACAEPSLDLCDVRRNARFGDASHLYPLNWRFLSVLDGHVDVSLSRDLDSRISEREVAAVTEFLNHTRLFLHVMRDHPAHSALILGGTWALKSHKVRRPIEMAFRKMFKDRLAYANRRVGGLDQMCLVHYVWRWARKHAMVHDSYLCKKYSNTRPFPTRREEGVGNFVGSVVSHNSSIVFNDINMCPTKCRPKAHPDWNYC